MFYGGLLRLLELGASELMVKPPKQSLSLNLAI
jgi:hypothetical protein